jgi:hypothetical protein
MRTAALLSTFGDAIVHGSPRGGPDRLMTIAIAPNRFCKRWDQFQWRGSRDDLLLRLAHEHRILETKDAFLLFPGQLDGARRTMDAVVSIEGIFLDYEGDGITIDRVNEALLNSGYTGCAWSTHSHREGDERGRIFLPLATPWIVDASQPLERRKAEYAARYVAIAESFGLPFDRTGSDLNRAMYTASHRPNAPWSMVLSYGERSFITMPDVVLRPERERVAASARSKSGGVVTVDQKAVAAWSLFLREYGSRFDISSFIEAIGWEVVKHAGAGKAVIACPNADEHSDPTAKEGCVALSPGAHQQHASITCRHAHCADIRPSEFLAMIESQIEIDGDPLTIALEFVNEENPALAD